MAQIRHQQFCDHSRRRFARPRLSWPVLHIAGSVKRCALDALHFICRIMLRIFTQSTTVSTGSNPVSVSVNTLYPFSDTLTTTINAQQAFTYYVRVPSWVTNGTISLNGGEATALSPSNGLQAVKVSAGKTQFVLDLPADITIGRLPSVALSSCCGSHLSRFYLS